MRHERGFTLTEVLIVVLVLSISAMVIVPLAGSDELTDLRAAAELLAADIEEVQARNLASPEAPTSLVTSDQLDGWHLARADAPGEPLEGIDGRPRTRSFGSGALATADSLRLVPPPLPTDGLRFDDQGAPLMQEAEILFRILGTDTGSTAEVSLSSATGRVSVTMLSTD